MAESWVLPFFWSCLFFWSFGFLFFWILVLFSHCRKTNNEPETKKPRNQKTKKTTNQKKTRLHTPRGGVVAESWVVSFFFCVFLVFFVFLIFGFLVLCFFWFWFCLAIAENQAEIVNGCKAVREPSHMCSVRGCRMQWKTALPGCPLLLFYTCNFQPGGMFDVQRMILGHAFFGALGAQAKAIWSKLSNSWTPGKCS